MSAVAVESRATDVTVPVNVTATFASGGQSVAYSTASLSATIINGDDFGQLLYQIDSGSWLPVAPRGGTVEIAIDFSAQTLKLKRGQFADDAIDVFIDVRGVPSGLYARNTELNPGGGVTLPIALAPNDVLADDGSNPLIGADANGNPYLQAYDGSHVEQGSYGFAVDGNPSQTMLRVPLSPPSGVTATSGTSGSLAAGTYYIKLVAGDGTGWSLPSEEVTAVISVPDDGSGSIAIDQSVLGNWYTPPWGVWRIYVGTASGAQDRYLTLDWETNGGVITDLSAMTLGTPPVVNTAYGDNINDGTSQLLRTVNMADHRLLDLSFNNSAVGYLQVMVNSITPGPHEVGGDQPFYYYGGGRNFYGIADQTQNSAAFYFTAFQCNGDPTVPLTYPAVVFDIQGSSGTDPNPVEGANPWTTQWGIAKGSMIFIWSVDYVNQGPKIGMLALYEGSGGKNNAPDNDSCGMLWINPEYNQLPGAVLHVRNPYSYFGGSDDPKNYVVNLTEGRADQVANLSEWKLTGGSTLASVDKDGKVDAVAYKVGGTPGLATFSGPVTNITVVNGIVTAAS